MNRYFILFGLMILTQLAVGQTDKHINDPGKMLKLMPYNLNFAS